MWFDSWPDIQGVRWSRSLSRVATVIRETDVTMGVIPTTNYGTSFTLEGIFKHTDGHTK